MSFILSAQRERDVVAAFERYREYLESVRDRFPPSAFALAAADWYYDPADRRCPHDAWLEDLVIAEPAGGERDEILAVSIRIRLLGAYHDRYLEFRYPRVYRYSMQLEGEADGHGDWLYDEFRLTEDNHVIHEIEWSARNGTARWVVEASDVLYESREELDDERRARLAERRAPSTDGVISVTEARSPKGLDRIDARAYFEELRQRLLGRLVSDRQLAGNSLSIWIDTHEGKKDGWTIWLDPSWHLCDSESVLAGSRQAQDETDPSGWQAVTHSIDTLVGRTLEALDIDPTTGDLIARFSGGVVARTFVTDPRDDFLWRIRDIASGTMLVGLPRGLELVRKGA